MGINQNDVNYWDLGEIRLRAAQKSDAEVLYGHAASSPARIERAYDSIGFPQSRRDVKRRLTDNIAETAEARGDDMRLFIIEETTGDADGASDVRDNSYLNCAAKFVGYVDVWEADAHNGVFCTGIKMIAGKDGKGYATKAFARVLGFYFDELRYQKCDVYIYDFNEASHKFHKKFGFIEEGRRRREYYSGGAYHDAVLYGLTAEDFRISWQAYQNAHISP